MAFPSFKRARDPLADRFGLTDVSPRTLAALKTLAAERDAAIAKLAEAEKLADHDALTPTLNRRGFLRELHRSMSVFERYRRPAAVLYIDLDGFKAVNDTHGHAAGDSVLRQIGRLLVDHVRESDVVGRLGGDEFGIILNDMGAEEARRKAEALSRAMDEAAITHEGVRHRVRASIGMHVIDAAEPPEDALARADEAMYAEKHLRRTRAAFEMF